ncbi:MAG: TRL-like family protein [Endomicrobia bacterium]|nr:TRL-like family protein [Endomicrobiia bacterium]
MKKLAALALMLAVFAFAGCVRPAGLIYTGVTSMNPATRVITTTTGSKTGKATSYSILGLVAFGNSGIAAAAKNGDIKKIESVDTKTMNILWGSYTSATTIVTGE